MAQFYYLISSLPMLKWDDELPISSEDFLAACETWVSENEYSRLEALGLVPGEEMVGSGVETAWYDWETCLRNRLAAIRAGELKRDAEESQRPERDFFSETERGIQRKSRAQKGSGIS